MLDCVAWDPLSILLSIHPTLVESPHPHDKNADSKAMCRSDCPEMKATTQWKRRGRGGGGEEGEADPGAPHSNTRGVGGRVG